MTTDDQDPVEERMGLHLRPVQHYEAGLRGIRTATDTDGYLQALCHAGLGILKQMMEQA